MSNTYKLRCISVLDFEESTRCYFLWSILAQKVKHLASDQIGRFAAATAAEVT